MAPGTSKENFKGGLLSFAQILLLLVFGACAAWLVVRFRDVIIAAANLYMVDTAYVWLRNRYIWLTDIISTSILACLFIAFLIYVDSYLKDGIKTGQLWQRAGKISIIQAALLALSYGLGLIFHY